MALGCLVRYAGDKFRMEQLIEFSNHCDRVADHFRRVADSTQNAAEKKLLLDTASRWVEMARKANLLVARSTASSKIAL